MKISYIANSSFPSHVPSSLQIVKTCEYLSKKNNQVTLVIPNTPQSKISIFNFYDVNFKFNVIRMLRFKKFPLGFKYYLFSILSFLKVYKFSELVISRNFFVIFLCSIFGKKCIVELHHEIKTESRIVKFIYKIINIFDNAKLIKIVAISNAIKKKYIKDFNIKNPKKIVVLPSGTSLKINFLNLKNKKRLKLGYFGSINYSKGINTIIKLARMDKNNYYFIYGGIKNQILDIKRKFNYKNLKIFPHQNYKKLPEILSKMDILLMPYTKYVTAAGDVSDIARFTSPLKLFDYMAAGKLIMCSDIPVLKEIVKNRSNCIIVKNFLNPYNWLMEINKIKNNYHLRCIVSRKSHRDVTKYHHEYRVDKYYKN